MSLTEYRKKRNFRRTTEPKGKRSARRRRKALRFVVQKHAASRLHYDFRLELGGVLKSWAVPKGPSLNPGVKRLAVQVEDHPLEYGDFEGAIPQGQYGGGSVLLWDRGDWTAKGDPAAAYRAGKLTFQLSGEKLHGAWTLVRLRGRRNDGGKNWLLMKADDEFANPGDDDFIVSRRPESVASGRRIDEIDPHDANWSGKRAASARAATARKSNAAARRPAAVTAEEGPIPRSMFAHVAGVRNGGVPKVMRPQLATLSAAIPPGDDWLFELKFDGYRLLARCAGGAWRLLTRTGKDWTERFPPIAQELARLEVTEAVLDGEAVMLNDNGLSDFQALQHALGGGAASDVIFYVFDLPFCDGLDLREATQAARKRCLEGLLAEAADEMPHIRYSRHHRGHGRTLFEQACRLSMEGLMAKRAHATYVEKRSRNWLKLKCRNRQEFVVAGFTEPGGSRTGFGALLLGVHDAADVLRYAGKVGAGFTHPMLRQLKQALSARRVDAPQVEGVPREDRRGAHWVKPELVAEVEFAEWTRDGRLRQPVFRGLRADKPAWTIRRETPAAAPRHSADTPAGGGGRTNVNAATEPERQARNTGVPVRIAGVRLTSPEKVLYPDQKVTKAELAAYYEQIADWVLPHVVARPLSVVRCPAGRAAKCFYQKHVTAAMGEHIHGVTVEERDGPAEYIYIKDVAGLVALVQLGVLELHPWGSRVDRYDAPDRMIFDLDPDPELPFSRTIAAALELRARLEAVGLQSFAKTTGGKGLHVVVPLVRRNTWDEVRGFSAGLARRMAADTPTHYVANIRKAKRKGRILIDYLRNGQGATAVAAYSTRARPHAPVATPVRWEEVADGLRPDEYNVRNLPQRLSRLKQDPWADFDGVRQSVTKAMRAAV